MKRKNVRALFVFAAIWVIVSMALSAQSTTAKPRVAVFGFLNLTGDDVFDIPAETAGKNLAFALRTLGAYDVSEPESVAGNFGDATLMKWCADNGVDSVLYGEIKRGADDGQEYRLAVFDAGKKATIVRESSAGQSVLDVFSASDELAGAVLGAITGRHIGFGSVAFRNSGQAGAYAVSVDGVMIADSPASVDQIVSGAHRVRVFADNGNPADGGSEIFATDVAVHERETVTVTFSLPVKIEMISVKGGSFSYRPISTSGMFDIQPKTIQVLPFLMGKYEVTQRQYASVTGSIPAGITARNGVGDANPVYFVSWYEAIAFCNALSLLEGLSPVYAIGGNADPALWGPVPRLSSDVWNSVSYDDAANGYRLPTDAEWEYAARGGDMKKSYAYPGSAGVDAVAWYSANASSATHAVGALAPNDIGIFDLAGNVREWSQDWYGTTFDEASNAIMARAARGGGWGSFANECTVSARASLNPYFGTNDCGFRVARRP